MRCFSQALSGWNELADKDNFDRESYRLSLLSELQNQPIADHACQSIGTIDDFAFSPESCLIAYAAVELNGQESGKRYPLPLGSFVVPATGRPWQVKLDAEAIRKSNGPRS